MTGLIPAINERFDYRISFNRLHAGDLHGEITVDGETIRIHSEMCTTKFVSKIYTLSTSIQSVYSLPDRSFLGSTVEIVEKGRSKRKEIYHDRARGEIVENGIAYKSPAGNVFDTIGLVVSVRDAAILGKRVVLYEGKRFFEVEFTEVDTRSFFKRLSMPSSSMLIRPLIHGLDRGHVEFHLDHSKAKIPYRIEVGMKFAAFTLDLEGHS